MNNDQISQPPSSFVKQEWSAVRATNSLLTLCDFLSCAVGGTASVTLVLLLCDDTAFAVKDSPAK
jgi:hypothetical protein